MTTWVIHGFNVSDGGKGSVGKLVPHLPGRVELYDYGWTGLLSLRCRNRQVVSDLLKRIKPGDILIGHSNGGLICWELAARLRDKLAAVVVINPALRRDARGPDDLPVLCIHNSTDWVVQLGRIWGRLVTPGDGWEDYALNLATKGKWRAVGRAHQMLNIAPHGWGAAGRYGFTTSQAGKSVTNWDSAMEWWDGGVKGHSGVFDKPEYWGRMITAWLDAVEELHG